MITTENMDAPTLIVVLGATGVGKTVAAVALAQQLGTEIVSCDSRQLYREMPVGTAAPTAAQRAAVPHHFIASHSIRQPYTAGRYETEALAVLDTLFATHRTALMVGGSGLYIDAVCRGIDDFPDADPILRQTLTERCLHEGLDSLRRELKTLDEESYRSLDLQNSHRIIRALEVTIATGKPYSSLKKNCRKERPFRIVKIGLQLPRETLYDRINHRVRQMMDDGWIDEARSLYPFRHLPALNTVGYKELFEYFDGKTNLDQTIALIQQHTRNYAKKQCSYWARDNDIQWTRSLNIENGVLKMIS
ncbi:MAG: tRNA (adenosine(37)-N6)-dimethylallyltransferase MiaA [Prevotellaceae bacterium]|jgi:tRNA dimethylallyltransferase|nr:tRNA (adenosine(37)-N6)-dimethylallyltransferase MiaA [Prevotellaceae bacterium]